MGVPTLEVDYTSAMPRREDHEVHKDMWGHWGGGGGVLSGFKIFGIKGGRKGFNFKKKIVKKKNPMR